MAVIIYPGGGGGGGGWSESISLKVAPCSNPHYNLTLIRTCLSLSTVLSEITAGNLINLMKGMGRIWIPLSMQFDD